MVHETMRDDRLSRLRRGDRWWPAEIVVRGLGALSLWGAWQMAVLAHRMEGVPDHDATALHHHLARLADLAVCTGVVLLLSTALVLLFEGPGLLRDVPLPRYFTQPSNPAA